MERKLFRSAIAKLWFRYLVSVKHWGFSNDVNSAVHSEDMGYRSDIIEVALEVDAQKAMSDLLKRFHDCKV